jgi:hypothetical protein
VTQLAFPRHDRGHYKPKIKRRGMVRSDRPCAWITAEIGLIETEEEGAPVKGFTGKKKPCCHKAFLYMVNHTILSLCICHAARLSKRKGLTVRIYQPEPAPQETKECPSSA